jgi:hypothetical protein
VKENWHSAQEMGSRKVVYYYTTSTLLLNSRVLLFDGMGWELPSCPFFEGVQLAGGKRVMGYSVDPPGWHSGPRG